MMWWLWTNPFVPFNPFLQSENSDATADVDVEEHMSAIAEHGTQACCNWGEAEGFNHFSQNWLRVTGIAPDDCTNQHFLEHLHPDSQKEFHAGVDALFTADPFDRLDSYHFEAQIMRGNREWGWATITLIPMQCASKRIVSLLVCDATEQKQLEQAVEIKQKQSEIVQMGRSSFLSNMSHELRTPLNAILGFAQLLKNRTSLSDDQAQDYLDLIQDSGQELLIKISDLIELANIDANCAKIYEEPLNLMDIVDTAIEMHSHSAFEKGITIRKEITPPQVVLHGDRTKLIHVMSNLLINAIRHSQTQKDITITCRVANETGILISIRDRGAGIDKNHLGAIKEALNSKQSYYCTDISSVRLGLSVSKEFIELHGGKLSIESVPNQGTIATIQLPPSRIASLSARVKPKKTFVIS